MRRLILLLWVLALAAPHAAPAQDRPSVDPLLRSLLDPAERSRIEAAVAARGPALATPGREPDTPGPREPVGLESLFALDEAGPGRSLRVGILVQVRGPAGLDALRAAGAEIGAVVGDIASARVPTPALRELVDNPALLRIEAARQLELEHDESMLLIRASGLRTWDGERWQGLTGAGVIMGVYDTGLDLSHRDFHHADGTTRVIGLWDQGRSGPRPPETQLTGTFGYGHYCGPAEIDAGDCPQQDVVGHGTHVTGSAAGGGLALGPDATVHYAGTAPGADLLIVNGWTAQGFREDFLLDGMAWLIGRARDLGQPIALNISLGANAGPRDGTSLLELAVDELSRPGNIIITSVGNHGANHGANRQLIHAMGRADLGTGTFAFRVPAHTRSPNVCNDFAAIEIWYPGQDELSIRVQRPDGTSAIAQRGDSISDSAARGRIRIWNDEPVYPPNNDIPALIVVDGCDSTETLAGEWTLEFIPETAQSDRPYHMWIIVSSFGTESRPARGEDGFDNRFVITSPAAARQAVAVGGYVVRQCWTSIAGEFCGAERPEPVGDLAIFSGAGPTRDLRLKPEVIAPGKWVVSSLSTAAGIDPPLIVPGGRHWVLPGTSMAAPQVAGGIAMMLQWDAALSPADVQGILAGTAIRDEFTQRTYEVAAGNEARPAPMPEHWWGGGKLDVRAALEELGALLDPGRLIVRADPVEPDEDPVGRRAARIPLLRFRAFVDGDETVRLLRLAAEVTGPDPDARVLLIRDIAGNGAIEPEDTVVASAMPTGTPRRAELRPDLPVLPEDTVHLILALELTGVAPHGARYRATYLPQLTRTVGVETLAVNQLDQPEQPVAGDPVRTRILVGEDFALSENPIRSDRVIFNFREPPRRAAIYTPDGRLVIDLLERTASSERLTWELRNHRDQPVVAGIYLAIFELSDVVIRERLLVVRPRQAGVEGGQP